MGKPKLAKIKGSKLDDVIFVEDVDVKVDGKKGVDMVVLGDIDDFSFSSRGNKTILTDGDGGIIQLKHVEGVLFDGGTPSDISDDVYYNVELGTVTRLDASVDAAGQTSGGNLLVGSGIPASDFVVVANEAAGVEVGLQVIYRQGPSVDPVSIDTDGTVHFQVATGAQSTANGSFANHAGRAAWSFEYSVISGTDGSGTDLSDYAVIMSIDVDVTQGVDYRTFTLVESTLTSTGYLWADENGTPVIGDDSGNSQVVQNSENFAFGFIENHIDADPDSPGQQDYSDGGFGEAEFDILLEVRDNDGDLVAQNHIVVDVVDDFAFV